MTSILAAIDYQSPLLWAVVLGWILSVVLHEFAHGLVAYLGGDYTIRERGGLTLNPIQYIDPLFSLIIPAVIFMVGGIPLPGGVTYVRTDLLRSRWWDTAVSLAGPAMNALICVACLIPLHPSVGWIDPMAGVEQWSNAQIFLGATAVLQFIAIVLNLVPVPPLDGFGAIAPFLPDSWHERATRYPMNLFLFFVYFSIIWQSNTIGVLFRGFSRILLALGFDAQSVGSTYYFALFGQA